MSSIDVERELEGTRGKEMRGKMDGDESLEEKWLFYLKAEDKDILIASRRFTI